jgi:hypothetical protein
VLGFFGKVETTGSSMAAHPISVVLFSLLVRRLISVFWPVPKASEDIEVWLLLAMVARGLL